MTDDKIALQELPEKGSDATLLREIIGFAAQRLMELGAETLCGTATASAARDGPIIATAIATALADPDRHSRTAHPKAAQGQVLPGFHEPCRTAEKGAGRGDLERDESTQVHTLHW